MTAQLGMESESYYSVGCPQLAIQTDINTGALHGLRTRYFFWHCLK